MEGLISLVLWAVFVYFWFHLISRSDIAEIPREWLKQTLGPTLSYPIDCAMCFSFWFSLVTWAVTDPTFLNPYVALTFVPVFNMTLDLLLNKLRVQEQTPLSVVLTSTETRVSPDFAMNASVVSDQRPESGWKS